MRMRSGFLKTIFAAGIVAAAFAEVKDYGDAQTAEDAIPAKIASKQQGEYAQSISAVGIAQHPVEEAALKLARVNSSAELARSIQEEVSVFLSSAEQTRNGRKTSLMTETAEILVKNVSLKSAKYAEELVVKDDKGFTAYVLRVIPVLSLKEMIDTLPAAKDLNEAERNVSQYSQQDAGVAAVITQEEKKKMLASQAYKELSDRVGAEKERKVF